MSLSIAGGTRSSDPVVSELAAVDRDRSGRIRCRQQAFLVVVKIALVDREVSGLVADTRAVPIRDLRAGEFEICHGDVAVGNENRLAIRDAGPMLPA